MGESSEKGINVFISHRHVDKPVADIFRRTIENWSNGAVNVYQSSNAENASRIAEDLDEAIANAISRANLLLLIYTEAPGDMDWCMYECGLAQSPQSQRANLAVFHTTEDPPEPLNGLIGMRLEEESVRNFTHAFHRDSQFFHHVETAIAPNIADEMLHQRANDLYRSLLEVAPKQTEETTVYDRLTLGLNMSVVKEIIATSENIKLSELHEKVSDLLKESLYLRSFGGNPYEHFNFSKVKKEQKFNDFVARWYTDSDYSEGNFWKNGVHEAITRAILDRPERECAFPFNSLDGDGDNWLLPILSRYRVIHHESVWEFDLLFCRLDRPAAMRMLSV